MALTLLLPRSDGTLVPYQPGRREPVPPPAAPGRARVAYAAAHVVCDPLRTVDPTADACIDWEATLAYRRYLWSMGLAVAEAMDTAQRGMGLTWPAAQELIRRSVAEARSVGGTIACGAGTDHLPPRPDRRLAEIIDAYETQCSFVEHIGGRIILMASRALAACASTADDYLAVYDRILSQVRQPVILHWLGAMFDPELAGYWGAHDLDVAMDTVVQLMHAHPQAIDGIKLSLLDKDREIALRRRVPPHVKVYTGDDFHYVELIRGDARGYSHALLGIFDAIAPVAAAALHALDAGDLGRYEALLAPTLPLARHMFQSPTRFYKTGVVFLAYLNGHQRHFRMLGGQESARSIVHLAELFVRAEQAGVLRDPVCAAHRMRHVLALAGLEQEATW
jgi:hypothetical protein